MFARVKQDHPIKAVTACGGLTFVKEEWRLVPAHEEQSASANPFLEVTDKMPKQTVKKPAPIAPSAASNAGKSVRLIDRQKGVEVSLPQPSPQAPESE